MALSTVIHVVNKTLSEPQSQRFLYITNFGSVISPSQNCDIGKRGNKHVYPKTQRVEDQKRERERDRNLTTLIGGMCIRRGIG